MQITLESSIRRSPHFDEHVWGKAGSDPKVIAEEYDVLHNIEKWRIDHNNYLSKFGLLINKVILFFYKKKQKNSKSFLFFLLKFKFISSFF